MPRAKGFSAWRPQKRTLTLLEDVEGVLAEYQRYLPMTVRQVFYRLVGLGHPKTEDFYTKVQEMLNRARRSGRISFASIRDDGVSRRVAEKAALGATRARRTTTIPTKSSPTSMSGVGTPTSLPPSPCYARLKG